MSTLRNPVGPKDRKVYIRRRIMVLAVIVAVIAVVVLIIVRPGSSGGAQGADEVSVPDDVATEEADPEASGDVPTCGEGDLKVTPATDAGSYAEGEEPKLSMTIENTGEEECSADVGTADMEFEISSGDDDVWRSTDCQEDGEHLNVVLKPGEPLDTESITWDRTRSSTETCDITRDPVSAGGSSYHLKVSAAGVSGEGTAQFLLN